MTKHDKEILRDDLYAAIKKVMDRHRDSSVMSILMTDSTEVMMTDAAMHVIEITEDAQSQWKDDGYLNV